MKERIAILGAGQAGGRAALSLREAGFAGQIVLIGEESHPPYERPPLSKGILAGTAAPESLLLAQPGALSNLGIEFVRARAAAIDLEARAVQCVERAHISFDTLLIATGARPRRLNVPGNALGGIHYLRTLEDSLAIREGFAPGRRLLVVGGGWIGLEVAATARGAGMAVTLLEAGERLCTRSLAAEPAGFLHELHRRHGVRIRLGISVVAFEGSENVRAAVLSDGSQVPADLVVIGIGIVPNDELAARAGIAVADGIVVDEYTRTSAPGVLACGDVARHPNRFLGGLVRLESWENAEHQAVQASKVALGTAEAPYAEVPWIWSDQFDCTVQLMGFPPAPSDQVMTSRDPAGGWLITAYVREGRLWGAVAFNRNRELKILRRIMERGGDVVPDLLSRPVPELIKLARQNTQG